MGGAERRPESGGWRVTRRERLLDNRWLRVERQAVELPDGRTIDDYYVVHEPNWAMVLAVTEAGEALLVRQYKHGIGRVTVELPAGYLEAGDASIEAAVRRELREETGYAPTALRHLASLAASPTRGSQVGHYYLATGCRPAGAQRLDATERIEVLLAPLADLARLVLDGTIAVESSVAGIHLGLLALGEAN